MGRADLNRDYYADLELPPTADVADVKKQFRKLALKYHPDRNPGREAEVNAMFQTIQSAHEILIDPEQKAKYDASRARSGRFASGVKGNPWKDVSAQYPTPPKRATTTRPPAQSGASRYQGFAPSNHHPTAKARYGGDPAKASRDNYNAWEKMRAASHTQSSQPQKSSTARPGPREANNTPPRAPASHSFPEAAARGGIWQSKESVSPIGPRRQSTPYHVYSGEKTNPFDGASIHRTPSTREPRRRGDGNPDQQQQRSSSVPRSASKDEAANGLRVPPFEQRPSTAGEVPNSERRNSARASTSYAKPKDAPSQHASSDNQHAPPTTDHGVDEPPVYAPQSSTFVSPQAPKVGGMPQPSTSAAYGMMPGSYLMSGAERLSPTESASRAALSEGVSRSPQLTAFETKQRILLEALIVNISGSVEVDKTGLNEYSHPTHVAGEAPLNANDYGSGSFTFSANLDASTSSHGPADFAGVHSEGVPARDVDDDGANPFHFSAGGHPLDPDARRRSKSTGADRSRSPVRRSRAMRDNGMPREQAGSDQFEGGFNPKDWGEKLGSYNVFSQPARGGGTSPTRPGRTNSKKPKNIRPTMGTAGMVNSESEEDVNARLHAEPASAHSPNAMDIDTPPPERTDDAEKSAGARGIPVEPSKPEWRPGDLSGLRNGQPEAREKPGRVAADVTGSEDSEDFMTSFAEFKNVAPFKTQPSGLRSFTEMKDSLPFESQASAHITIENEEATQSFDVSSPPKAPQLPVPFNEETKQMLLNHWPIHVQRFQRYLHQWGDFNTVVLGRFSASQSTNATMYRNKGPEIMSEKSLGEQLHRMEQDREVRRKWTLACDEHEQNLREFRSAKKKMESIQ